MVSWFSRKGKAIDGGDNGSSASEASTEKPKSRSLLSWFSTQGSDEDDTSRRAPVGSAEEPSVQESIIPQNQANTETGSTQAAIPNQNTTILPQLSLPPYVEPSHVMCGVSSLFFFRAYRVYHSPLESLIHKIAKRNHVTMAELEAADIAVRKAVGAAVAGRALRLATLISFGSFGMFGAAAFFICDWKSVQEGVDASRKWGKRHRKKLDELLGVEERIDDDHPEMIARKQMSPEEESAYLAKRYWIAKNPDSNEPNN